MCACVGLFDGSEEEDGDGERGRGARGQRQGTKLRGLQRWLHATSDGKTKGAVQGERKSQQRKDELYSPSSILPLSHPLPLQDGCAAMRDLDRMGVGVAFSHAHEFQRLSRAVIVCMKVERKLNAPCSATRVGCGCAAVFTITPHCYVEEFFFTRAISLSFVLAVFGLICL